MIVCFIKFKIYNIYDLFEFRKLNLLNPKQLLNFTYHITTSLIILLV